MSLIACNVLIWGAVLCSCVHFPARIAHLLAHYRIPILFTETAWKPYWANSPIWWADNGWPLLGNFQLPNVRLSG